MPNPEFIADELSFEELKKRGDRAIEEGNEAIRKMRTSAASFQRLHSRIEQLHHKNPKAGFLDLLDDL